MDNFVKLAAAPELIYAPLKVLALASARFFGLTITFTAFNWGQINSGVLRMGFVITLAAPMMAAYWADAAQFTQPMAFLPFYALKEILIGAFIGFICTLPFQALMASGALVDATRGITTPIFSATGESSALGVMFEVTALWIFVAMGGFWRLAEAVYASYGLWPMNDPLPELNARGLDFLLLMLSQLAKTVLTLAGPLLILMLLLDGAVYASARFGKSMNVGSLSPNIKNIVVIGVLPLFVSILVYVISNKITELFSLTPFIDQLAQTHGR